MTKGAVTDNVALNPFSEVGTALIARKVIAALGSFRLNVRYNES